MASLAGALSACGELLGSEDGPNDPDASGPDATPSDAGVDVEAAAPGDLESFEKAGTGCGVGWVAEEGTAERSETAARTGTASCLVCMGTNGGAVLRYAFVPDAGSYAALAHAQLGPNSSPGSVRALLLFNDEAGAVTAFNNSEIPLMKAWHPLKVNASGGAIPAEGLFRLALFTDAGGCMSVDDITVEPVR